MNTKALAAPPLLAALAALAIGCSCGGASTYTQPAAFTPSKVTATRSVAVCALGGAQYAQKDPLSLDAVGSTSVQPPYTELHVALTTSTPVHTLIPLYVDAANAGGATQTAQYAPDGVRFELVTGSNPAEIDATGVVAVVLEVMSMPETDGQPLSVDVLVTFNDGRELHDQYQAAVTTVSHDCPLTTSAAL
jgi:hypothetical protein